VEEVILRRPCCRHRSTYDYTPILAKLIEACYRIRVTELKELADFLGISVSYAHHLIKRLNKDLFFKIWAFPSYDKIGLRALRCLLQVESVTQRQILLDSLSRHDFVSYTAQYYGSAGKGIYCEFLVPDGKGTEFTHFLESLRSDGVVSNYAVRPMLAFENVVMGFEWYDFSTNAWIFNWPALLRDVISKIDSCEDVSSHEFESSAPSPKFDLYDLYILHHLEQDVFTPITSLAIKMGTSPQNLSYHYRNHVRKNGLIRTTRPSWYPFLLEESSPYILEIEFESMKALRAFLASLNGKPIAYSCTYYEQAIRPSIMLAGALPYDELFNLTDLLDLLMEHGVLKNYDYYIVDVYGAKAKSLPYRCYDEALGWRFDLEPCLREILKATKKAQEGGTKFIARLASAADSEIESV